MVENKKDIIWRAAEYEYVEKGVGWYWGFGTSAAILIMIALWQRNFFFFLFLVIASLMVVVFGKRKPKIIEFKITDEGIDIGGFKFYKFRELEGFDFRVRPGRLDELILKKKTSFNPIVKIPIDSQLAKEAEKIFADKMQRFEYNESFIDILGDWMGF